MEPSEQEKTIQLSRAKEIDTGAIPLPMSNVLLGLPYKPDPTSVDKTAGSTQMWTYSDLVSQKKLLADIKVDQQSSGVIWKFDNNWNNVIKTHFGSIKKLFGLKSWTINFKFEFRSNFQQVGMLNIFYSNSPASMVPYHFFPVENPFDDFTVQCQLPHRKIMMGEDQDCDISLSWISPHKMAYGTEMFGIEDLTPVYDQGQLFLAVPFKMETASGVDSVMTVRIWTFLTDFKTGAYKPYDDIL